jgi:hypothetical protein
LHRSKLSLVKRVSGQRAESKEQRAKSREQRAESREQREERREQRTESRERTYLHGEDFLHGDAFSARGINREVRGVKGLKAKQCKKQRERSSSCRKTLVSSRCIGWQERTTQHREESESEAGMAGKTETREWSRESKAERAVHRERSKQGEQSRERSRESGQRGQ